jgi:hypothetical protein
MSKMEKSLKKHMFSTIWAIMVVFLLVGCWYHKADFNQFWALWGTESIAFGLVAFYFWKPTATSSWAMLMGTGVWLINQVAGWYHGELLAFIGEPARLQLLSGIYIATFVAEGFLLYYALSHKKGGKPPFKLGSVETTAMIGLIIMALYSGWKIYWTYSYGNASVLAGTPIYISGMMWAGGIGVMSAASIVNMKARRENTIAMIIALVGLLIAAYAALYYGLALALTGV